MDASSLAIWLQTLSNLVMAFAAVIGFWCVVRQIRQVDNGLRDGARASIYQLASDLKAVLVEHPEYRAVLFHGEPAGEGIDPHRLEAIVDFYCLYLEQIATQRNLIEPHHRDGWMRYVASVVRRSGHIAAYLEANRSHYSLELLQALNMGPEVLSQET